MLNLSQEIYNLTRLAELLEKSDSKKAKLLNSVNSLLFALSYSEKDPQSIEFNVNEAMRLIKEYKGE